MAKVTKLTTKTSKKSAKPAAVKKKVVTEEINVLPIVSTDLLNDRPDVSAEVFDEAELASINEQNFINGAMDHVLSLLPDPTKESLTHCKECEAKIPIGRRKALPGVELCTDCQQLLDEERKRKQRLRGYIFRAE